jgi:probable rRNA maturation factor
MAEAGPSPGAHGRAKLHVEVVRRSGDWDRVTDATLALAAKAAFENVPSRHAQDYEIAIALVGDDEVRELNRTWRGQDNPTNVLSFPAGDDNDVPGQGEASGMPVPLGDVILGFQTVAREAKEQDIAFGDHACHLTVHGVLHLLGFDHDTPAQTEEMEGLERRVLAELGIDDPYAGSEPLAEAVT